MANWREGCVEGMSVSLNNEFFVRKDILTAYTYLISLYYRDFSRNRGLRM